MGSLSQAATNWVSPTGNNTTGNGTATNPYATIQKAIDVSATGDLIMLKAGTYSGTGNANLTINNESLMFWSESGSANTIVDAGRQKILTANLSGDPGFLQQLTFHGITFTNGYTTFGGDWTHDSLVRLNSGTLEFYDCVFRQNEVTATYVTANVFIMATGSSIDSTNTRFLIRNTLFTSNRIGCGGWVNSIGGGGGAVLMGPTNSLLDRSTFADNNLYAATSGNGTRRVLDGGFVTNVLVLSNGSLHQPNFPSGSLTPYAISAFRPIGYSYVDVPGATQTYTNSLTNAPLFVNTAAGNFDPAFNSPVIHAGDPVAPKDPDGSRADIGYSSARALSGSNWVNALPSFTNNSFTGGTFTQWEVFSDSGATSVPILNAADAVDGKEAQLKDWTYGVTILTPAFVCGEGWRVRARYRNPGGVSSCGFVVYDSGRNRLVAANLEDDPYAVKEYDLSRFAGQAIKVGFSGGDVRADYLEILAPAAFSGQTAGSRRPNSFLLQSSQAGSTTDIDNLRVVDLDAGVAVYSNSFTASTDATNNLSLWYYPQGGQSTTNFTLNGSMTRVVSGRLRLETTGFNANGSGGYESHSEAEWGSTLPRNFLVEFEATRMQWAGHFHFHLFRKEPSDALGSHMIGGAMSSTRSLTNRQDVPRMAASGDWFQQYGVITNWNGTQGWAVTFPAPGGSLQSTHRLGMSLSNSILSFYLDGSLLSSTNIQDFLNENSGSAPVFTSTNSFSGTVGLVFSNTVTASGSTPITFSASNLPAGLTNNTNGLITGTPTTAGTNTATLTASNSFGTTNQSVTFAIARGTPVISNWPTATSITYGQALSNSVLTGGVANPTGNFTWTFPTNKPNAGTNSQSVTFTPMATNNYNSIITNIILVVNKATPVLTWAPSPATGLTYPAPLSSTQLNATSSVAGSWSYNPTNGSVLNAGTNTLVGTFTPTDVTNYTGGATTNTVVVAKGSQNIIFGSLPIKYIGDAAFSLTATASSGLTVTYTSSNTNVATVLGTLVTIVGEGATDITASQAGDSNWNAATSVTQTLTVQPAINRGLVAYYPFNGNANDESGNGNHASVNGASLTVDRKGSSNAAYSFNGSGNYIQVPGNRFMDNNTKITISAWYRFQGTKSGQIFASGDTRGGYDPYSMRIGTGGFEDFSVADTSAYRSLIARGSLDYRDGVWRHIAMVLTELDASTSQLRVFQDGALVTSTNMSPKLTIRYDRDMVSQIGAIHADQFWQGQLDEFRFYNRDLSAAEISQLYQQEGGVSGYTLFGLDAGDDTIYIIDPVTGALRPFALAPFDLGAWPAFDYNPANQKLYLIHSNGSGPALFEVNTQLGAVSSTPALAIQAEWGNSLGFTGTGDFYLYQERSAFTTGTLHFVNGTTGASTARATPGASPSVLGGDFDFQNNFFYGTDEWNGKVYRLNPADGSRVWTSTSTWYTGNGVGDLYDMDITPKGEILVGGSDPGGFRILHLNPSTGVWTNWITLPRNADFRLASVPGVIEPPGMAPVIRDHPLGQTNAPGSAVTFSVAAVSPGANILTNTGFEGSTGGWYAFGGAIAPVTNASYTGSNAVSLTRSSGYARLRYSNSLAMTSGVSYLATAMVRDGFAISGDEFEFWNDNPNGPVLVSVRYPPLLTNNLAGGTNWVQVRQLFTCTNSGNGAIMLVSWNPPTNAYVVDNFEFRPCTTNGLSYQWQQDGVAISNATSATLSLTNLQTNQAGAYRVVVRSSFGSVTSEVASLFVGTSPAFTSTNSFSGTVGVAFSNTVTASGSTPITFRATNLPAGLTIATNGLISGTPTTAGTNTATLTASNAAGSINQSVTFTVARGAPVISNWPTASPITFGQALSNSVLAGGTANVTGSFAWTTPTNRPNAGTNLQSVTFTPTPTNNYVTVSTNINLVVNRSNPALTWAPSPAASLTYPAPLSSTQLNATSTVAGSWSYSPTNGTVLNAGTNTLVGTFTPTDTTNHVSGLTVTNTVVVAKGSNNIIFGALLIKYVGDAAFNLTATASSGLTVSYSSSNTNVATVLGGLVTIVGEGTTTITASQAGNSNWNAATSVSQALTVQSAVNRGLLAYLPFIGNANDVTGNGYNGNLQGVTLTTDRFGATNQAYYFAGNNEHMTLARNLPDTQELTFVGWVRPDDSRYAVIFYDAAYFTPGRDTEIAINTGGRLQATFTKPDLGGSITTGEVWPLGQWVHVALVLRSGGARVFRNGEVVGSSDVAGNNMGYHSAPFLGAANHGLYVEFGFKGAMDEIRFYSRGLSDSEISQLYQTESGGLTPSITSTNSFSGTVGVTFSNQATASGSTPITFRATNLPAGLSIASNGVISGTPTTAGTNSSTLTASNGFGTTNQTATFVIAKGTPVISNWPTPGPILPGQPLSNSVLSGGSANVAGSFAWTTPSFRPNAGTNSLGLTFTPTATNNYVSVSTNLPIVLSKITPVLTWTPSPAAGLTYPAPLSSTQLNATSSVAGAWTYSPSNGTVLNAGTNTLVGTFTPADTTNYSNATISNTVVVAKGSQNILFGSLPIKYVGDAAFNLTATASSGLTVSYTSSNTNVATVLGDLVTIVGEGTTTITASQAGNSNWNAATSLSQALTVQPALNRGLIAYYPFNGNANDESGNGYHATNYGATLAADRFSISGKAYGFDGNDYLQTPVDSNMDTLTLSTWFATPTRSGERSLVDSDVSSIYGHSLILGYWDGGNSLDIQYHNGEYKSPWILADSSWHHAVAVIEPSIVHLYVDGQFIGSKSYTRGALDGTFFRIGRHNSGDPQWFQGQIDEVRIYNRALSAAEAGQLYQQEAGNLDTDGDGLTDAWERGYGRYQIVPGSFTATQAKADAAAKGGAMATFTTAGEWQFFLANYGSLVTSNLRIGLEASNTDPSGWAWVTGEAGTFRNWDSGQPNGGWGTGETTAVVYSAALNHVWHDFPDNWGLGNFNYLLEFGYPTDPLKADTDGDGYNDNEETVAQTDPNDPCEYPGSRAPVIASHPQGGPVSPGGSLSLKVSALSPGANLLTNSGFESGTTNWMAWGGSLTTTNLAYSGSNAVVLVKDPSGYARLRYGTDLTLPVGVPYLISSKIYGVYIDTYEMMNGNNGSTHDYDVVNLGQVRPARNTNWVDYRWILAATSSVTRSLNLLSGSWATARHVVDDFYLRPCTTNGLAYQWLKDGVAISNATGATLSLTNLQANQAGAYRVVVSSRFGSVTSEVATLNLGAVPLFTSTNSLSGTVGVSFTHTVTASGSTPIVFGGTNLPGGLSIASNGVISGTPTTAGTNTATLTASNSFGTTNQSTTFTVARGTPVISNWPTPGPILPGQPLSNSVLSGGSANVPGSFAWTTPSFRPNAGTNSLGLTFTPTATNNYVSVSTNLFIVLNRITPVLAWTPSPAAGLTYPAPLSSTQLNATSSVAGTWNYSPASGTVLNAGTNGLLATFTPADTNNYISGLTISNTVIVAKGTQTITFAPIPGKQLGNPPFDPGATASSGLPVSYVSSNTNVAVVTDGILTVVGVGNSLITASQAGNGNYQPAAGVAQTLEVYGTPIGLQFVEVAHPGNPADSGTGFGQVNTTYRIGTYEVTLGQYAEFLNAVAANDPYALFHPAMETNPAVRGILRSGSAGSYQYSVIPGSANKPVTHVSWFDAARYCNWLHNGATNGASTETGAYLLNGATNGTVTKTTAAKFYLPSENQWYKAGHYDAAAGRYWRYAVRADTLTTNQANISGAYIDSQGRKLTEAGFFTNAASAYGTHDQAGNVSEWTDDLNNGQRVIRSGSWGYGVIESSDRNFALATLEGAELGFRVAASGVVTNGPVLPAQSDWEYTFSNPTGNPAWKTTTGLGGGWLAGRAPFGNYVDGAFNDGSGTYWPENRTMQNDDLWIRRSVDFSGCDLSSARWFLGVDNGYKLYVNGVLVSQNWAHGYTHRWEYSGDFGAALLPGINVIALALDDEGSLTAFDMEITADRPTGNPPLLSLPESLTGQVGVALECPLSASGTAPLQFTVSQLPAGLQFSLPSTGGNATIPGLIAGIPILSGSGTATVTASNAFGVAQGSLAWTILPGVGTIEFSGLAHRYDGTGKAATVGVSPTNVAYTVTYNGSTNLPVLPGSYQVVGTLTGSYAGSATNTLLISPRILSVTNVVANAREYDGSTEVGVDLSGASLVGVVGTDRVSLFGITASGVLQGGPNPGLGKLVVVEGLMLDGEEIGNYELGAVVTTVDILPRGLGIRAKDKSKAYGEAVPVLEWELVDPQSLATGHSLQVQVTTTATNSSGVGEYAITVGTVGVRDGQGNDVSGYYGISRTDGKLTINRAVPGHTWPAIGPMGYGTALGTNQLNAISPVAGNWSYSPGTGTVLGAGPSQAVVGTFAPQDTTNYAGLSVTNRVTVNKAKLVIRAVSEEIELGSQPALEYVVEGLVNNDRREDVVAGVLGTDPVFNTTLPGVYRMVQGTVGVGQVGNYEVERFEEGVLRVKAGVGVAEGSVTPLAGGYDHSVLLRKDGGVSVWGSTTNGLTNVPVGLTNVAGVAAGSSAKFSLAWRKDGTATGWGNNSNVIVSGVLNSLSNVVGMAGGDNHGVALLRNGTVRAWGTNNTGQTNAPANLLATNAAGFIRVVAVSAAQNYAVALRSDGRVQYWGTNSYLGIGSGLSNGTDGAYLTGITNAVGVGAGSFGILTLHADGSVQYRGLANFGSGNLPGEVTNAASLATNPVVAVAAGGNHGLAMLRSGRAIGWGDNNQGQTNVAGSLTNVAAVAGGQQHSLLLSRTGSVTVVAVTNNPNRVTLPSGIVGAVPQGGPDSDGDGWSNEAELRAGSHPLNAQSLPGKVVLAGTGTNATVIENGSLVVGTLKALDRMGWEESLVNLGGARLLGPDAGSFEVVGQELRLKTGVDYETLTDPQLQVTLEVQGLTQDLAITVQNDPSDDDTVAPVITLLGANPLLVDWGASYSDPGARVTDNVDAERTILGTGAVDVQRPGNYTVTYTASDLAGNRATNTRTVQVRLAPLPTNAPPLAGGVDPVTAYALQGGSAEGIANSNLPQTTLGPTRKLRITAVVRTNDPNLSVNGWASASVLGPWTNVGTGVTSTNQTGVDRSQFERREYEAGGPGQSRVMLRLKYTYSGP